MSVVTSVAKLDGGEVDLRFLSMRECLVDEPGEVRFTEAQSYRDGTVEVGKWV